jgi:hypothetical protein
MQRTSEQFARTHLSCRTPFVCNSVLREGTLGKASLGTLSGVVGRSAPHRQVRLRFPLSINLLISVPTENKSALAALRSRRINVARLSLQEARDDDCECGDASPKAEDEREMRENIGEQAARPISRCGAERGLITLAITMRSTQFLLDHVNGLDPGRFGAKILRDESFGGTKHPFTDSNHHQITSGFISNLIIASNRQPPWPASVHHSPTHPIPAHKVGCYPTNPHIHNPRSARQQHAPTVTRRGGASGSGDVLRLWPRPARVLGVRVEQEKPVETCVTVGSWIEIEGEEEGGCRVASRLGGCRECPS